MTTIQNRLSENEKQIMHLDLCENHYYKIIVPTNAEINKILEVRIPGKEQSKLFKITKSMIETGSFLIPMEYK